MDDELSGGPWRIHTDTRTGLRLERIRGAMSDGEWGTAIVEAEELLDEAPQHPEALFLLAEALLEEGDFELARTAYEQRVRLSGDHTPSLLGLAITAFQTCMLTTAVETAREVVRREPGNAEAHYYLGLALERLPGHGTEGLMSLSAAANLEPERFPLPMQLGEDEWQELVTAAVIRLHPRLREFYTQVQFRLEDLPSLDELRTHDPPLPPTLGALYTGTPPNEQSGWEQLPQTVRLFARNLGRAPSPDDLITQLSLALQEEALEWVGASIEDL